MDRLYVIIRAHGTKEVKIEIVKLLCDAWGSEISALQPYGGDLSPLCTPLTLKTHIVNKFMDLYPDASLV